MGIRKEALAVVESEAAEPLEWVDIPEDNDEFEALALEIMNKRKQKFANEPEPLLEKIQKLADRILGNGDSVKIGPIPKRSKRRGGDDAKEFESDFEYKIESSEEVSREQLAEFAKQLESLSIDDDGEDDEGDDEGLIAAKSAAVIMVRVGRSGRIQIETAQNLLVDLVVKNLGFEIDEEEGLFDLLDIPLSDTTTRAKLERQLDLFHIEHPEARNVIRIVRQQCLKTSVQKDQPVPTLFHECMVFEHWKGVGCSMFEIQQSIVTFYARGGSRSKFLLAAKSLGSESRHEFIKGCVEKLPRAFQDPRARTQVAL